MFGSAGLAVASPLKVMSVNVLEDNGSASSSNPNRWVYSGGPDRRDRLLQVISDYDPDLLGVQEALSNQVSDLTGSTSLSGYGHYMVGVADGLQGGVNDGIFYRTGLSSIRINGCLTRSGYGPDQRNCIGSHEKRSC